MKKIKPTYLELEKKVEILANELAAIKNIKRSQHKNLRDENFYSQNLINESNSSHNSIENNAIRFYAILNNLNAGVVVHAADSSIILSNPKAAKLLGLSQNEMLGKLAIDSHWKFIHPNKTPFLIEEYPINRVLKSKKIFQNLVLGVKNPKTKNVVWLSVNGFPVIDNEGNVIEALISFIEISKQKSATEKFEEMEQLFHLFIKHSPIYTYIKEVSKHESKVLIASDNFTQMIGDIGLNMNGKTMQELFPPEFAKKITYDDWNVVKTGNEIKLEEVFNNRYYSTIKFPIALKGKKLLAGYTLDITDYKNSEEKIRKIGQHYQALIDNAPDGVALMDGFGNFKFISPAGKKIFGYPPNTSIKRTADELTHPEDLPIIIGAIEKLLHNPSFIPTIICRFANYDQSWKWIECTFKNLLNDQNIQSIVINFKDISERKMAEDKLKESEEKYRLLIENASEAIYVVQDKNIVFSNRICELITGFSSSELMNKQIIDLVDEKDKANLISHHKRLINNNSEPINTPFSITHKCGQKIWVSVNSIKIVWNGKAATLNLATDITSNKIAEFEIQQKNVELQRINAEKDKFFSIIAHDLKSPFNAFIGFTELLVTDLPTLPFEKIQDLALIMRNSALNLYNLLENLLEWSQLQRGLKRHNPTYINLNVLFNDCLHSLKEVAQKKQIEIFMHIPTNLIAFADTNMLSSIVRNLASNSIKFTNRGGEIHLIAEKVSNDKILITVKDNGIGMSKHLIQKLFKLDENTSRAGTEKEPSTGLGLILSKDFIEKNGGEIWVESKENEGSSFCFTLPNSH